MICCKCNEDKPNDKCIVKRNICVKCDRHERYIKNRDRDLAQAKKLYAEKYKNDPEFIERRKEYDRGRKESCKKSRVYGTEKYREEHRLRSMARKFLIDGFDTKSYRTIIGCSLQEFRNYIESKFRDGMTWENYGPKGWHIDHIKPCCMFDLLDPQQQLECFHYTNLQPLWWHENLAKGKNYND